MSLCYFNHYLHRVDSGWMMGSFVAHHRQIYGDDPRWIPPYHPLWRQALNAQRTGYWRRMNPLPFYMEALARRRSPSPSGQSNPFATLALEEPVAAGVLLADPRRRDGVGYLAWLHLANDPETLARLLDRLRDVAGQMGLRQLVGPLGFSPYLQSGVLQDSFDRIPPLHTPYNPPYVPELMQSFFRPLGRSRLYSVVVPPGDGASGPAEVAPGTHRLRWLPLAPRRLAQDLLPLFQAACPPWPFDFPPPDEAEADFLLQWVGAWPLEGWLVEAPTGEAAGFVLLQPDLSPQLQRARGGKNWLWRGWLNWRRRRPVAAGRLLFGGVLPEFRGQGIGRALWACCLHRARARGWRSLTLGPLPTTAPAASILPAWGATPGAGYLLHRLDL